MINFCTLFDSNYLTRGLAMYESLKEHCANFQLYIFPFDDLSLNVLKKLNLKYTTIISLEEFEDEKLLAVKSIRNKGEYCWTSTPSIILYALNNFDITECTYLDADLYFFSSPEPLLEEVQNQSVLITNHRYTPKYDQSIISGKYCVQFITFKKNNWGLEVLEWWRNACLEWCYNRVENGKFGDQKYLDDWLVKFKGIIELSNLGGGVAPWNIQQYNIFEISNKKILLKEVSTQNVFELIFYHFHDLRYIWIDKYVEITANYEIANEIKNVIYLPYITHLKKVEHDLVNNFGILGHEFLKLNFSRNSISRARRLLFNTRNIYNTKKIWPG